VTADRIVRWEGFSNARDLGGLPITGGGVTVTGAYVRSGTVDQVGRSGWAQARAAGIATVVDLREPQELPAERPPGVAWGHVALDDTADTAFWDPFMADGRWGTPLYYPAFLAAKPDRVAAAITTLARARGGVLFHCAAGRDRTGLVTALLLSVAGVEPEAVAADFALSADGARELFALLGMPDQGPAVAAALAAHGTTGPQVMLETLDGLGGPAGVRRYLLDAGVEPADLDAIRDRLAG
jgi:hypothetical protein